MTLDLSWRPNKPGAAKKRTLRLIVLAGLLIALYLGVFLYHGDPRHLFKASQTTVGSVDPNTPSVTAPPIVSVKTDGASEYAAYTPILADDAETTIPSQIHTPTFVGPPQGFEPMLGIRSNGVVQRVERIELKQHRSLGHALVAMGVRPQDAQEALVSLQKFIDYRRLRPTDIFKACFDAKDTLVSLEVHQGPLAQTLTRRTEHGWHTERTEIPVETVLGEISGEVHTSLWNALVHAGESPALVQQLVDIFAYEIDFYSEVRPGDSFTLLVEKRYGNGQFLGYGDVTAAEFITGETPHRAFLFRNNGQAAYYDEKGLAMRKQLLRAPLSYGAVTSNFGVRKHPVLGYTRNHNGTDYGVPIGTPVWSVGEGRVITAGWHGGYGRLVEVSHPNGWVSQYAHLSKILVRPGQHVHQKDVVGLVGQTGLATGPHLHYGLKKNGHFVNSLTQKFERAKSLGGHELTDYIQHVHRMMDDLVHVRIAQRPNLESPGNG